MYTHLYDKLSEDHRQQMRAEAAMQRLAKRLPRQSRQPGLGRRAIGRLGAALVVLGSRLESVEKPAKAGLRGLAAAKQHR